MDLDIGHILEGWPYRPGQVTARRIVGADGREKIQLRLDLGLLQMEASGRPDGRRPHGHESLLAWHEWRLQRHTEVAGSEEGFALDEADCEQLRAEGVMYYHRYLAEFVLGDWPAVERDTMRNLRLMDFCRRYARDRSDRFVLEQYRPYLLMMCTRARAHAAIEADRPKAALAVVRKGIEQIEALGGQPGAASEQAAEGEIAILRALERDISARIPVDPLAKLREQLDEAIAAEQYERAAELRDRIRSLTEGD